MSDDISAAFAALNRYQSVPWVLIPDLGLYMDQVITFIDRIYCPLYGGTDGGVLSSSMINNYVKAKLIPRPAGKKYSREQIALLAMIVPLKQVASMEDIRRMLTLSDGETVEWLYEEYCQRFNRAIQGIARGDGVDFAGLNSARDCAILAAALRAGCAAALRNDEAAVQSSAGGA